MGKEDNIGKPSQKLEDEQVLSVEEKYRKIMEKVQKGIRKREAEALRKEE
jgi:hypothetical protein